jgi:hypothetical protein
MKSYFGYLSINLCLYLSSLDYPSHLQHPFVIIACYPFHFPQPFIPYLINPYSSNSKRRNLEDQWPQQQCHESTTSRLVVGHPDPTFRDLGENAMNQIIGATHRRKTPVRKDEG